jgi:hypothetical protein
MRSIANQYAGLFHHTGISVVEGILRSQTLWATHAAFLNDAAELVAFKERLPAIIRPDVAAGVAELVRQACVAGPVPPH